MKMVLWMAMAMGMASIAPAASIVAVDPYCGTVCGGSNNSAAFDVIGKLRSFDINYVSVTNTGLNVEVIVRMNYGANGSDNSLSPIAVGSFPLVNPGDVLLSNGANLWAIPLISHTNTAPDPTEVAGGMVKANLYSVSSFLTAATVLGNPSGGIYRPTENVWGNSTGAVQRNTGSGTRSVTDVLDQNPYELEVKINFALTSNAATTAFLNALGDSNTVLHFASATCGNDVVNGSPTGDDAVPEPASLALMGVGLLGIGIWGRKRLA